MITEYYRHKCTSKYHYYAVPHVVVRQVGKTRSPPARENAGIACSAWKKTTKNGPPMNIDSNTRWHSREPGEQSPGSHTLQPIPSFRRTRK